VIPFDTAVATCFDKTLHTGVVTFLDTTPETQTEKALVTTFATSLVTLNTTKLETARGTQSNSARTRSCRSPRNPTR
jgi:hypothetical protein